jgi:hypothetical protein
MSGTFECGDNIALVEYLYGECEPDRRAAIAAHVVACGACGAELATLESTRIQLTAWTPPEAELGFVISRPDSRGLRRGAWYGRPLPAWAQVAAAAVIFATGVALGIARGTAPARSATSAAISAPAQTQAGVSAADLTMLEQRLRREIAAIRTGTGTGAGRETVAAGPASENQMMASVRALIEESEQRQQRQLALRTADILRDFDAQRRTDLAQIQRSFGQIEGITEAEVREQRQMLNYLMRVSQGQ